MLMFHLSRIISGVAITLWLSAFSAAAQEGVKVTVRSAMFPGTGIQDPLVLYTGESTPGVEVPVWGGKFSPEFELPRREVWRFGEWASETNDEGKVVRVFKEKGHVKPPADRRLWLVFFREGAGDEEKLRVSAFGVDEGSLKEGGSLVMNFSKGPVGVQIGDKKVGLKPGKRTIVEPGSKRGQVYPVKFFYSHNGSPRPFVATTWFHGERRKRLAIILQGPEGSAPKLLTVDDIAADEEAP